MVEQLPADLLFHIITFLEPNQLIPLWRCSSKITKALNEDRVWMFYASLEYPSKGEFNLKRKEIEAYILENNTTWKGYYKDHSLWTWSSTKMKSELITLSNRDKTASRPQAGGKNPAILTSRPFSPRHHTISVKIDHLTVWVGVGFCDETLTLTGSHVLGAQEGKFNSSLFQQKGTTLKVRFKNGESERIKLTGKAAAVTTGDIVTMLMDFEKVEARYFLNNTPLGTFNLESVVAELADGKIFPAVCISSGTVVSIVPPKSDLVMDEMTTQIESMAV